MTSFSIVAILGGAAVLIVALVVAVRLGHRRLPSPDADAGRYEDFTKRLTVAHDRSAERTRALNRELDALKKGRRYGDE